MRVSPEAYNAVINTYKTPIMGLGEIALVAAIGLHALNGLRIILIDFSELRHQAPEAHVLDRHRASGSCCSPASSPASSCTSSEVHDDHDRRSPQHARARRTPRHQLEKWGWIYMRCSGVVLVVLIFGHLFVNLVAGEGVKAIDFAFVAGKLADPFWMVWDTLLLWLALIHGANGMRTLVNDYANNRARPSHPARRHRRLDRRPAHPGNPRDLHLRPLPRRLARRAAPELLPGEQQ